MLDKENIVLGEQLFANCKYVMHLMRHANMPYYYFLAKSANQIKQRYQFTLADWQSPYRNFF
jgi:hypothetical protein